MIDDSVSPPKAVAYAPVNASRSQLLFVLILAAAAVLRLYLAATTTYLWDEDTDWIPLARSISLSAGNWNLPIRGEFHPALPAYLMRLGAEISGPTPLGYRLLSVVCGVLTILVAHRMVREWLGEIPALLAAALFAFNDYHIQISALATEKASYLLFLTLATYAFAKFLRTDRTRYLFLAAGFTAAGFYCKETAVLVGPVFLLALLLSDQRRWLLRPAPYLAAALFAVLLVPDVLWNMSPAAREATANYSEQLSRVQGITFTYRPALFYLREPIRTAFGWIGHEYLDSAEEYAAVNPILGVLLLLGAAFGVWRAIRDRERLLRYFAVLFVFVFCFFTFVKAGLSRVRGLEAEWFWVDLTLIAAVALVAREYEARNARARWAILGIAIAGIATASYGVLVNRLAMAQFQQRVTPTQLQRDDVALVPVEVRLLTCAVCDPNPTLKLLGVNVEDPGRGATAAVIGRDVDDLAAGTDDRTFRVRASPVGRRYRFQYQLTMRDGSSRPLTVGTRVVPPSETIHAERFW